MSVAAGEYRRGPGEFRRRPLVAASVAVAAALGLLALAVVAGSGVRYAGPPLALLVLIAVAHEQLLAWRALLGLTILVILFVPIKRYTLPAALPFHLELYRLAVAAVFLAWLSSLLVDPRVRLRASGLEAPLLFFLLAILLSLLVNLERVKTVERDAVKQITFFLSFFLVFYLVVSLVRRPRDIDFLVRVLAGGGAVLGVLAVIESATGVNIFNHVRTVLPMLYYDASQVPQLARGGRLRVYASAQHPIALGAAFAVLIPLGVYRARVSGQWRWWLATLAMLLGLLATRSRTGVLMLLAAGLVYILLRPQEMKRLWWAVIPILLVVHLALPGALGTVRASFFPRGGVIQQQQQASVGSGRLATLGPALDEEFKPNPVLGEGYGTRVTVPDDVVPVPNGPILDDQWLGVLLETGVVGTFGLLWLYVRSLRRMGKAAKRDPSPRGWLLVGTTAAVAGYAVGMFTYDSFSFVQVTFLLFIVLGLGAAALLTSGDDWERLAARQADTR